MTKFKNESLESSSVIPTEVQESDESLMQRVKKGDEKAFQLLFKKHDALVHAVLRRLLLNEADVQDLFSEIMHEVWKKSENFDPIKGKFLGWIIILSRRKAIDHIRRREAWASCCERLRLKKEHEDLEFYISSIGTLVHEYPLIRSMVLSSRIPKEQREALQMHYFEGLSQRTIVEMTHVPLGTIKTRLELGIKKLKILLSEEKGLYEELRSALYS